MLKHLGGRCHTASSRNSSRKCAKDGQSVGMRPAVGAPNERFVFYILLLKGGEVRPVLVKLGTDHGLSAICSCVLGIRGSNANVKGCYAVAKSRCQYVRWAKLRARY